MRCRVCGSNNEDGSKFCWNCGNKLTEQSEAVVLTSLEYSRIQETYSIIK